MNTNTENTVETVETVKQGNGSIENLSNAVEKAITSLSGIKDAIRLTDGDMLAVLTASAAVGKFCIKLGALDKLFKVDFRGIDRRQLVTWFESFSPIRIAFEESGTFKQIRWSETHVKNCKRDGKPVFDLSAAANYPWWDMVEAAKGMSLKTRKAETIATMAVRAATKAAIGESKDGKFRLDVFEHLIGQVIRAMRETGNKEALEYAGTDRMEQWTHAMMVAKAKAESTKLQAEAESKKSSK